MKQYYNLRLWLTVCLAFGLGSLWGQTYTFEYSGSFDSFIVPAGVSTVAITAKGGQGASGNGSYVGGKGASMYGEFEVTPGDNLIIVVGGQGEGQGSGTNGGGGGGSFVVLDDPGSAYTISAGPFAGTKVSPMIIAGGGGGTRTGCNQNGNPGLTGDHGGIGVTSSTGGGSPSGVTPGYGGAYAPTSYGSGGGGFIGDGGNDPAPGCGGKSFLNGANGGSGCGSCGANAAGGFGGGGQGRGCYGGGGGGGYTGGGGGWCAGGGGSYNDGTDQVNIEGERSGDGVVIIEVLCIDLVPSIPETGVCIGETLTLDVDSETGGVITWSGGVTDGVPFAPPLGTTTYYAYSSSDADCAFEIDISASEEPTITAHSSLPAACEGALITLWGEGGDEYTWTGTGDVTPIDSVPFLAEGGVVTYTVFGSYLGCEGEPDEVILVGAPQPNVVGVAEPSELCLGESYTVTGTGSGAVGFYWGGGIEDGGTITPESTGTIINMVVGVSEDGCYDTSFVTVNVHPKPIVSAGPNKTVCEGNSITLTGSGAETYVWDPAITDGEAFVPVSGETVYTVIGTDANGCVDDDDVLVTVVDIPEITDAVIVDEYFGYDGSIDITVEGGSGEYTYSWSHGPITEDVVGLTAGIYTVEINDITIDPGKCPIEETFVLTSYTGIEDENLSTLNAYPNPTNDLVTIVFNGQFNYAVTNLLGEVVIAGNAVNQENISLANLADGTYIIKVKSGEETNVMQIVKN